MKALGMANSISVARDESETAAEGISWPFPGEFLDAAPEIYTKLPFCFSLPSNFLISSLHIRPLVKVSMKEAINIVYAGAVKHG